MAGTNYDAVVPETLRVHVENATPDPTKTQPYRWVEVIRSIVMAAYTWHKVEYRKLSFADRIALAKDLLGIEIQVLVETLGQNHPVHHYIADLFDDTKALQPFVRGDLGPCPTCGAVTGEPCKNVSTDPDDPAAKPGDIREAPHFYRSKAPEREGYAATEDDHRIYQTHERPFVVATRKNGEVMMLVGKTEVLLSSQKVAELVKELIEVGQREPAKGDAPKWQRLMPRVIVPPGLAGGGSPVVDTPDKVHVSVDPNNPILHIGASSEIWRGIADRTRGQIREALGLPR